MRRCLFAHRHAGPVATGRLQGLTDYTVPHGDIVSISFTDGALASLTHATAVTDFVEISTDGAGDITSWAVYLSTQTPAAGTTVQGETIASYSTPIAPLNADVSGNQVQTICGPAVTSPPSGCNFGGPSGDDDVNGGLTESAGSWSAPSATPEPSAWIPLAGGLLFLAGMKVRAGVK